MASKKRKTNVEELSSNIKLEVTENTIVGMGDPNPSFKLEVKQEFSILKSFTLDKHYHIGDIILLSDKRVIKELKINKYIK
ncbi:hypothetical protein [Flavobacterium sp.]|jgi:hypothetical protein|uniref:hypothetical protein n=1 Tax=Flavobacterium sp. TaxID=239 RepID=UPI0025CE76C8|nr:hypothetical protein [Flavobacterium sp.]